MGILYEYHPEIEDSLGGGVNAPFFTCDTCGEKLTNGLGKIVWEYDDNRVHTGRYWILGKGDEHSTCDEGETRKHPWEDLDEFLLMAAHNSGMDLAKAAARTAERKEKFGI